MNNKKSIIAIIILCSIITVGITFAYFTSTSNIENIFNAGTYKTVTTEEFTPPEYWRPGDETPKTITTKNEGTLPVRVRVKLTGTWTSKNDDTLPLYFSCTSIASGNCTYIAAIDESVEYVAIINLDNTDEWIKRGDYYYYINELAPGEETSSPIRSVTFNPNTPPDVTCSSNSGEYTCESTGDGYDGGTYQLNITTETVQADAFLAAWNLSQDPTEEYTVYTAADYTQYDTYEETNKRLFARITLLGETPQLIEYGFILNNNDYYVTLTDSNTKYNENRTALINAYGNVNCTETTDNNRTKFMCYLDNITAELYNDGEIMITDNQDKAPNSNDSWTCSSYLGCGYFSK